MAKRLTYEESRVDLETGEIVTVHKRYSVKTTTEAFYMAYIENLTAFFDIKSLVDTKVLQYFCIIAEFNTGTVHLTAARRVELCGLLKITTQQVTNSIASLKRLNLMSGDKGTFQLNPTVYWKGTPDARKRLIDNKLSITVDFEFTDKTQTND